MKKKRKIWKLPAVFLMSILLAASNSIYMPVTAYADENSERNAAGQEMEPETNAKPNVESDSETTDENTKLIEDSEEPDSFQTEDVHVENEQLSIDGICYIFNESDISIGAACTTNASDVTYRWLSYNLDTRDWKVISDWSGSNWSSWKPEKGNYWLQVQARMSDGTIKSKTICFHVDRDYQFEVRNILPVQYNDRIVLNAQYINGNKPVIFKWMIYDKSRSEWETLADWTVQESVVWNPKAGDYKISLQAADRDGNLKTYTIDYQVTADYSVAQTEAALLSVGQGKEFATINDAVKRAIEMGVSNANPVRIFIGAGYYNEQILLADVHGLTFEGEDRTNTTIEYAGGYPDCVIHVAGDVTFANLTMRQKGSTYTVHVDPLNTGVQGAITFSNCSIQGGSCALGYGSGVGTEVHLLNCELRGSDYIIYTHNSPYSGSGQKLVINGCSFIHTTERGVVSFDDVAYSYFGSKSPMVIIARNNTYDGSMPGKIAFRKDMLHDERIDYIPKNEDNILLSPDNGNNYNILGLER